MTQIMDMALCTREPGTCIRYAECLAGLNSTCPYAGKELHRRICVEGGERITGARDIVEEAACLIWAELCPGLIMGDGDLPHYENAARAVLALPAAPEKEKRG